MRTEAIIFAGGALLGAIGGFIAGKIKYESIQKENERELREHYENKLKKERWTKIKNDVKEDAKKSPGGNSEEPKYMADKGSINKYYNAVHRSGYIAPNAPIRPEVSGSEDAEKTIEIIPPEWLGREDGYEEEALVYYAGNDILTDEAGEQIDNREDVVGEDFVKHFGEFEKGRVVVINRAHKCYYVIELDIDKYPIDDRPMRIEVN